MPDNQLSDSTQKVGTQDSVARKDPDVAAKNNPCSICRANRIPPPCKGHGGKGGGGGAGGGDSEEKAGKSDHQSSVNVPGQLVDAVGQPVYAVTQVMDGGDLLLQPELNEKIFNSEVISDLLSKELLLIDNDRNSGILTVKLRYSFGLLSEERRDALKNFVDAILKELRDFKKENGISASCAAMENDNERDFTSLRITLPKPGLYDAFIQRLASKNLLPVQNIEQNEKVVYQEGMNHFNPSPLSMKSTPITSKNLKKTDEEKHQAQKHGVSKKEEKTFATRPRSPLDGLKPKGWE